MRNRFLLPILIAGMSLFLTQLSGCAHLSKTPTFHYIAPNIRNEQALAIKNWEIEGALSIQSPQQSVIAHYQWDQKDKNYDIELSSALNLVRVNITGRNNQFVQLCRSNKQCYRAKTPELLLKQQLGWDLPLSYLEYWIRGIPFKGEAVKKYDQYGHLIFMQQHGFDLWFSNYKSFKGVDLPTRLDLQYPELKIRLIIKQWNI
jgi:outer membrane lipoprotein LolB